MSLTSLRWLTVTCSLAAAGIAAYLAVVSWQTQGTPWGCGAGSGCADVLRSQWSTLFGVPVGAFAFVAYLLLAVKAFRGVRLVEPVPSRTHGLILPMIASAVITADLMFVVIQLFVLKAICPWCMASHAAGIVGAIAALGISRRQHRVPEPQAGSPVTAPSQAVDDDFDLRPSHSVTEEQGAPIVESQPTRGRRTSAPMRAAVSAGVSFAIIFLAALTIFGGSTPPLARLPKDANADTGPGPDRAIAVLQGKLPLLPHEVPMLGSADAPKLIAVMFDYACPHCRATHAALRDVLDRSPDSVGLILLPTPLNAACNPAIEETEPRFQDSCELARLSLAVWRAAPDKFREYDEWLFEPELPRSAKEAQTKAEELVGRERLDAALSDPWIDERIRLNTEVFRDAGIEVLPVLLSPGAAALVGRTDDDRELFKLLQRDFGIGE